jgi:hypothetical protein
VALQVFSVYSVFGVLTLNTEDAEKGEEYRETFARSCWSCDAFKFTGEVS